jgi:hypothetical protein
MIQHMCGLAGNTMGIKRIIFVLIVLFLFYSYKKLHSFELQGISFEWCTHQALAIKHKMHRKKIVHVLSSTAAAVYTLYSLKEFLFGNMAVGTYIIGLSHTAESHKQLIGFEWFKNFAYNSVCSIVQFAAYNLCAQCIVASIKPDFSIQACIKKYGTYKKTIAKIEGLLQSISDTHHEQTFFIIQVHMQKMICDIAHILVYLIARTYVEGGNDAGVISFATTMCESITRELTVYQEVYHHNPVEACRHLVIALTKLSEISIQYTLCAVTD